MKTYIVTFFTISDALIGERAAKEMELDARLIPVPREISTGCGICLKMKTDAPEKFLETLKREDAEAQACLEWEEGME
ncbi:MAG: DUF3343 domain-containing protein [Tissierellia bacterium]|jgi:hypothetical protein|nr:DUF3343 domain-containing protein [Bacillota bacterium]NLL22730.1 DUF3343 domain-containing protein [Tissierellia bacterium]